MDRLTDSFVKSLLHMYRFLKFYIILVIKLTHLYFTKNRHLPITFFCIQVVHWSIKSLCSHIVVWHYHTPSTWKYNVLWWYYLKYENTTCIVHISPLAGGGSVWLFCTLNVSSDYVRVPSRITEKWGWPSGIPAATEKITLFVFLPTKFTWILYLLEIYSLLPSRSSQMVLNDGQEIGEDKKIVIYWICNFFPKNGRPHH